MKKLTFKKIIIFIPMLFLVGCLESETKISIFKNAVTTPGYVRPYTPDPLKNFVTLLIQGTGSNGSTAIANYVDGTALVANDLLAIDTAIFPTGAINFDGVESTLTGIPQASVLIGLDSFCWEAFITVPATGNDNYEMVFDSSGNGSANGGFFVELSTLRGFVFGAQFIGTDYPVYPTDGLEHHWMVSRDLAGNILIGLDGVIVATGTNASNIAANPAGAAMGNYTTASDYGNGHGFKGSIRGVRLTIGDQRYTGNYEVPYFPLDY